MLYRPLAPARIGVFLFFLCFRHVHVNADAVFVGKLFCADAKLIGVVEYRPQAKPDLHAPVSGIVIFFDIRDLLLKLLLHRALPDRREAVTAVHHRLGELSAQTGLLRGPRHAGDKLTARLGKRRYAGADQLQTRHECGNVGILLRHIALKGPHSLVQPADKIHIVADTAGYLLRGVDVGIHKSGQNIFSAQVDDLRVGRDLRRIDPADRRDAVVFHEHPAAVKHGVVLIHGDDIAVLQKSLHVLPPLT